MKKMIILLTVSMLLFACSNENKGATEINETRNVSSNQSDDTNTKKASKPEKIVKKNVEPKTEEVITEELKTEEPTSDEATTTEEPSTESSNSATKNTKELLLRNEQALNALREKLAVAFFVQDNEESQYILSAKEILSGQYAFNSPGDTVQTKFSRLIISPIENETAPKGIAVYSIKPSKGTFMSFIAFTDTETIIGGTQSELFNLDKNKSFIKYNTKEMLQKYRNLDTFNKLTNIIEVMDIEESNKIKLNK